jgi:hypothetical protein
MGVLQFVRSAILATASRNSTNCISKCRFVDSSSTYVIMARLKQIKISRETSDSFINPPYYTISSNSSVLINFLAPGFVNLPEY